MTMIEFNKTIQHIACPGERYHRKITQKAKNGVSEGVNEAVTTIEQEAEPSYDAGGCF